MSEYDAGGMSGDQIRAVQISAEVRQIKTMADGTINLTLNLPEYCVPQAQVLLAWIQEQVDCVIALSS